MTEEKATPAKKRSARPEPEKWIVLRLLKRLIDPMRFLVPNYPNENAPPTGSFSPTELYLELDEIKEGKSFLENLAKVDSHLLLSSRVVSTAHGVILLFCAQTVIGALDSQSFFPISAASFAVALCALFGLWSSLKCEIMMTNAQEYKIRHTGLLILTGRKLPDDLGVKVANDLIFLSAKIQALHDHTINSIKTSLSCIFYCFYLVILAVVGIWAGLLVCSLIPLFA